MKARITEHIFSIALVGVLFALFLNEAREGAGTASQNDPAAHYLELDFIDFGNPLHVALFKETLNIFYPGNPSRNDSLVRRIQEIRKERFADPASKTGGEERGLSRARLSKLGGMYAVFAFAYGAVILLSYLAARTLAIYRFVKSRQGRPSYLGEIAAHMKHRGSVAGGYVFVGRLCLLLVKALLKGLAYAVLFSPAYVIAYSTRSSFETGSYVFLIVLGIISNGYLITYANKLFTLLVAESRKGYVQTAIVKNLDASYAWGRNGISRWAIFHPDGLFPSHVFRHIYLNAHLQYIPSLKEQAAFLVTGLIIIEMALNIQGHLGYELLQGILYKQYTVVMVIVLGIFLIVKATEVVVDVWFHRETRKYENQ